MTNIVDDGDINFQRKYKYPAVDRNGLKKKKRVGKGFGWNIVTKISFTAIKEGCYVL